MSKIKVLIIGYGSIGRKYHRILKKIKEIDDVVIFTSQKKILNSIDSVSDLKKINPDIIIISSTSNTHYKYLKIVNSIYKNKRILVEKPLFVKLEKIEHLNNKIFVGYNLRFLPVIKFLKKYLKKKKVISAAIYCGSYLPSWRKRNINQTSSYDKKISGGILLELSHEIDYSRYLFGNLKNIFLISKKLSSLSIKDDDYCNLAFYTKEKSIINITLNYYSHIKKRFLIIDTKKESFYVDLINGEITIKSMSAILKRKFNYDINKTYKEQVLSIIRKKFKDLCSYNDAYETLKTVKQIKKKL